MMAAGTPANPSGPGILRSRFFWNLSAAFTLVVALTGALVGWQIQSRLERSLLRELERDLSNDCQILSPLAAAVLSGEPSASLQAELERLRLGTGLRVTLVQPGGRVV